MFQTKTELCASISALQEMFLKLPQAAKKMTSYKNLDWYKAMKNARNGKYLSISKRIFPNF